MSGTAKETLKDQHANCGKENFLDEKEPEPV
jgi:hypothetical protein